MPPSQILHNPCFSFLLGQITAVPREIENNAYEIFFFWGGGKEGGCIMWDLQVCIMWDLQVLYVHCCIFLDSYSTKQIPFFVDSWYPLTKIKFIQIVIHLRKQGHPRTVFCKISVRGIKYCLEVLVTWGRLKMFRWPFHSCLILEAYLIYSLQFSEV